MSCLDVMYHQSYGGGGHCLPASQAAAAAAYKAAYYHHQQQQRKLSVYSKMQQECVEQQQQHCPGGLRQHQQRGGVPMPGPGEPPGLRRAPEPEPPLGSQSSTKDGLQPAEAEYLSSRCVLFTYFHGDIGDVVDEHFSRALSQSASASTFGGSGGGESKPFRAGQPHASSAAAAGQWKDGVSLSENQSGSVWNSAYHQSQSSPPCLPSSSSVHPDFSPSPVPFHPADGALWAGHALSPPGASPLPDSWTYSLNAQGAAGASSYPHVHHDAYTPRTHPRAAHVHAAARHAHAMLRSYPAHHHHGHAHALDHPRFAPLLLPAGVRGQPPAPCSPGSLHGSSPHSEGIKTEMDPGRGSPVGGTPTAWPPVALHGPPEGYDTAVDQDKAKATAWF